MHGGAPGSGAPLGNKNALKDGHYTREAFAERRRLRALLHQTDELIKTISEKSPKRSRGNPRDLSPRDGGG
jgi:glucans biosynthesis protein